MKKWLWLGLILMLGTETAWGLRCGPFLVLEGDHIYQALQKCGQPDFRYTRVEYRWIGVQGYGLTQPGLGFGNLVPVYIDEWIYNFGPQQFMQRLIFENGRLIQIKILGYGH
jgi:hypothetical protein